MPNATKYARSRELRSGRATTHDLRYAREGTLAWVWPTSPLGETWLGKHYPASSGYPRDDRGRVAFDFDQDGEGLRDNLSDVLWNAEYDNLIPELVQSP